MHGHVKVKFIKLLLFIRYGNTAEINFLRTKINTRYIY